MVGYNEAHLLVSEMIITFFSSQHNNNDNYIYNHNQSSKQVFTSQVLILLEYQGL